ncbi:MAG: YdgA family protein [Syntrophobacteraceae bacterium]|nr:YdgA family protein [Syntrophobacteraceae bacterium]
MKRLLGGILVLAVLAFVALGAASYWFGVQTEREYKAMMQRSADWQNFKLTGEEYTRGVFSSEAKATLELANPPPLPSPDDSGEEKPFPFKVMLVHQISHGPVPFGMLPHAGGIMRPALAVIETKASLDPRFKELFKELKLPRTGSRPWTCSRCSSGVAKAIHTGRFTLSRGSSERQRRWPLISVG